MRKILALILVVSTVALVSGCTDEGPTEPDLSTVVSGETSSDLSDAAGASKARHGRDGLAVYHVTITNLTSGQPLTPPLLAVHRSPAGLFSVGEPASFELMEIAENGNLAPMLASLADKKHVVDVEVSETGPLVPADDPGGSGFSDEVTLEVRGERGAKYLSLVSMLICTNDGITGVDGQRLPQQIGESITLYTNGYDAGTEMNTEDFADMVPPCQGLIGVTSGEAGTGTSNPAIAEDLVVRHHPGIAGGADLDPNVHGWTDPVARVVVTRTE